MSKGWPHFTEHYCDVMSCDMVWCTIQKYAYRALNLTFWWGWMMVEMEVWQYSIQTWEQDKERKNESYLVDHTQHWCHAICFDAWFELVRSYYGIYCSYNHNVWVSWQCSTRTNINHQYEKETNINDQHELYKSILFLIKDSTNISSHCVTSNIMNVNQNVKARSH